MRATAHTSARVLRILNRCMTPPSNRQYRPLDPLTIARKIERRNLAYDNGLPRSTRNSMFTALQCRRGYQTDAPTVYGELPPFHSLRQCASGMPRVRRKTRNCVRFGESEQVLMIRIRRFNWTCGSRPPTLILQRQAATLTKTELWDRILTAFVENFRPISGSRRIVVAMPVAGVLEWRGANSHG
jgi:hypothetical protein